MEIHVQRCQFCDSEKMRNILYRQEGEPDRVFVQCCDCKEFVASYKIAPLGYYHHGKGFDSFLRSMHRSGDFSSARDITRQFNKRQEEEVEMFNKVISALQEKGDKEE